ncbi:MAG: hypothetical protein ISQ84_00305 [Pelagibacterales bacterium]|nr:hypothetical protein [Pelagibacterales bacterium]
MAVKFTKPEINVREKLAELDKPSGLAGEAMLRAETPQEQFNLIGAGRKNLLYNGAMMINQRGTQSGITSARYTLDRWGIGDGTGGVFQVSQSTNVPDGFQNAWQFETTTADTDLSTGTQYVNFYQALEGQDLKQLAYGTPNAKPITLSFWVKSSKAGQFASELEIVGGVNVQPWTVNQEDTWEYKTVTFEGNTSTAITTTTTTGMWVVVCWMAAGDGISGPNFQSGWRSLNQTERLPENIPNMADSTSNIMRFTGVQLEVGKVATPFEHRSYGEELALCQRYYQKFYDEASSTGQIMLMGLASGTAHFTWWPSVEMRARPTVGITTTTPYWESFPWYVVGTSLTVSSISNGHLSRSGGEIAVYGSFNPALVRGTNYSMTGEVIYFDAEL